MVSEANVIIQVPMVAEVQALGKRVCCLGS